MGKHRQTFRKAHHKNKGDKNNKRVCLGCNKKFDSLWVGNRLCKRCRVNVERNE